jgi:CRISPR-associated protein Csm2
MTHKFKHEWITTQITEDCIQFTEEFGKYLVDKRFTTSQIRIVYGEIKRIQMSGFSGHKTDFLLLRPKMAYAAKRAKSDGASDFEKVLKSAHQAVASGTDGDADRFKNFCDFAEAILAFHKAAGGRD